MHDVPEPGVLADYLQLAILAKASVRDCTNVVKL